MNKVKVIKIGGSILSNGNCETGFFNYERAKKLARMFLTHLEKAVFIIGGGKLNKWLLENLKANVSNVSITDQHYVGIAALNVNAELFRIVLLQECLNLDVCKNKKIFESVLRYRDLEDHSFLTSVLQKYDFAVVGANKPGTSSDFDALIMANALGANTIVSIKDVKGVFDADPKKNKEAKLLPTVSWQEYLNIIKVSEHMPRANYPVDPVTAKDALKQNIKFYIVSAEDLENVQRALEDMSFVGSVIG